MYVYPSLTAGCPQEEQIAISVELIANGVFWKGMRFAMREGGHTVAAGVVTSEH